MFQEYSERFCWIDDLRKNGIWLDVYLYLGITVLLAEICDTVGFRLFLLLLFSRSFSCTYFRVGSVVVLGLSHLFYYFSYMIF